MRQSKYKNHECACAYKAVSISCTSMLSGRKNGQFDSLPIAGIALCESTDGILLCSCLQRLSIHLKNFKARLYGTEHTHIHFHLNTNVTLCNIDASSDK